jgi:hypothetical protein
VACIRSAGCGLCRRHELAGPLVFAPLEKRPRIVTMPSQQRLDAALRLQLRTVLDCLGR